MMSQRSKLSTTIKYAHGDNKKYPWIKTKNGVDRDTHTASLLLPLGSVGDMSGHFLTA